MTKNKIVPILLIIFGVTFVFTSISLLIDKPASTGISGLMETWRGWLATVSGFVSAITALIVFFRKDKHSSKAEIDMNGGSPQFAMGEQAKNIQGTNIEEQHFDHPKNVVIGTQYQTIYEGVDPRQVEAVELQAALDKLAEMPENEIPEPTSLPKGSHFPKIPPNKLFVGRQEDLKQLAAWLKGENPVAIGQVAAATGMGGIGKTQLASEFAHRYGQYFAGGVFWLSFAQPDLIPSEVAACGDLDDVSPLEERVNRVLADWQSGIPRLLIFDNCEDTHLLVQWRPPTGCSRVLITSRQGNWDPSLGVQSLTLGVLKRSESIDLLRGFRKDLAADDHQDLDAIAKELGDLPLALHMAGNFLHSYRHDISLKKYLEGLRQPGLLKHRSLRGGEFSPTGHDLDVGRTFSISIKRLNNRKKTDRLALDLLTRIACFASGEFIERELLRASIGDVTDATAFGDGMDRLLGFGLVEENEAGAVRMHRLVACFVQDTIPGENALSKVEQAVTNAASKANNSGYPARMHLILVHLKQLTDQAEKRGDEQAASLANNLGYYLNMIADFVDARPYFEQALAIRRKVLGEEHPDTANCLNNLGFLLQAIGDYAGARPYYEQALAINKKVMGEEHPDTASSLNNMGYLLGPMGDYAGARPYFEQALAIRRKALGEEHPDTALSLNNLGYLLQAKGDYAGARPYFEQALAINKKVLGEEHPDTALSLNNLGYLLQTMGDYAGARPYFEQALAIRRKVLGEEHSETASSLNNLGSLLQAMGDYAGARPYFEQALAINKKVLGDEHPNTAASLNNLGSLLQAMGDYAGARPYYEQALAINKKILGEEHPVTATSLNNMGYLLQAIGDYAGARPYYEQALAIHRKALGEEHPDTALSLNNMGELLLAIRDSGGARPYFEQALAIRRKALGEEHPDTATSLNNIGYRLQAIGDYASARPYFEQALAIFVKILGADHPNTKVARDNLEGLKKKIDEKGGLRK